MRDSPAEVLDDVRGYRFNMRGRRLSDRPFRAKVRRGRVFAAVAIAGVLVVGLIELAVHW